MFWAYLATTVSRVISGTKGLIKNGTGTLTLSGANTYTGGTTISAGTIQVNSATSMGNASGNLTFTGNGTIQLGTSFDTSRNYVVNSAVVATIDTQGFNQTNSGTISGAGGLISRGAGTLVLAGNNTYTGTTTIKGGPLVLDYSGLSNTADPLSTGAITLDMGTLVLKGKSSGSTSETISTLNMGANLGTANTLRLDSNGGSGIALNASTFVMNTTAGNTQNINLIDLSSSASNSITVGALGTGTAVANGVIMGNSNRANLVVRDSTGYGFATLSNTSNGTIGRLSTGTTLNATLSSNTANYRLDTAGTVTRTAALDYSTITLDSTAGAVTLDMGANNLTPSGNGRGILVTGSNDVSITGSGRLEGQANSWFHNYSAGTFTFGLSTAASTGASLVFGGSGLTVWTGTSNKTTGSDSLYIEGGIFRPTAAQNWTTSTGVGIGGVWVSSGAVVEVGADLNGATAGDLTNTIGNSASAGNIRFWGNSGVSASGANRTVNFGNGTSLTWGSNSFLTDAGGTGDGNYVFKLSSNRSDSTVTVQNAIALGSLNRTVEVADGSAATDAILSGVLSGTGGLVKSGAGALTLSNAANTYTGATTINAGTLTLSGGLNNSSVTINGASAVLNQTSTGTIAGTGTTLTLASGNATLSGSNTYTGATTITAGTLITTKCVSATASKFTSASFTNTTLSVTFGTAPLAGETYRLFPGATTQTYASVTLVGATGRTATYNSANSTLTIA